LLQPVPDRALLSQQRYPVHKGQPIDPDKLARWLVDHGFRRTEAVELPGEFGRRGGILDVFSPDADAPFRLEFFGDEIDSIRQFSPATQRSLAELERTELSGIATRSPDQGTNGDSVPAVPYTGHLCDYLPEDAWTAIVEPEEINEQGKHYLDRVADLRGLFSV